MFFEIPTFDVKHTSDNNVKSITGFTFSIRDGLPTGYAYKSFHEAYDAVGRKKISETYNGNHQCIRKGHFDHNGKLLKEEIINANGTLNYEMEYHSITERTYEKRMYLPDRFFWLKYTVTSDPEGRIIKEVCTDKEGNLLRTDIYLYDEQGNVSAVDGGDGRSWEYTYDKNNCLARVDRYAPSGPKAGEYYAFFYDERLLLRQAFHSGREMTLFEYAYY